tara:strand:- start:22 stop:909 length:888 start_codon:yes stop_codon:yes gene_type:complete
VTLRFACLSKNNTNPAYEGARIGASLVAERLGAKVTHYVPENPDDVAQQAELLQKAIASLPDAILISPAHPSALDGQLCQIGDIPLIYFVCNSDAVPACTFVTSNNYELAHGIADTLIEALGGSGRLVIVDGAENSPTTAPRTHGFLDAIAAHSEIHLAAQYCGEYQKKDARRGMIELLDQGVEFEGVLVANDFMALGVIEALEAAGRDVPAVGINATPDAIQALQERRLLATASFNAMAMACIAAEAAYRIVIGEDVPKIIELPVETVDRSNCARWNLPYEERPLPEWGEVVGD